MIRPILLMTVVVNIFLGTSGTVAGKDNDCAGPWQKLYNRDGRNACRVLGLDTDRGICRPGDRYVTYCDDRKGGEYRICQGEQLCSTPHVNHPKHDCRNWDYKHNRQCPSGQINADCQGGCSPLAGSTSRPRNEQMRRDCVNWDFDNNRPCGVGKYNLDCRGGCDAKAPIGYEHGCTHWDYDKNRPCPKGYANLDCMGGCASIKETHQDCRSWDFRYDQPCPPGFINRDCKGSCERR